MRAVDLQVGDILVVGAGERVATDGIVEEGASSLDTSAITGESIPVAVGPRDEVSAGSVNGSGTLRIRATAAGTDNSLTQIVRLVEQAHSRKGDRARLADRIARPLVPAVLFLSASVALLGLLSDAPGMWLERALVVLVAASPCAMAIAVPVTVISAIGSASRLGVVIKSGQAFEQLGTVTTVALDKTGTLTRNQPGVVAVATAEGFSRDQVLGYAAALEATSTHRLAEAVRAASSTAAPAIGVEEYAGRGVVGAVDGRAVRVGSARWVAPRGLQQEADDMAAQGMSIVVLAVDEQVAGVIGVRDELRPEASEAVSMLRERGIEVLMLTGDNRRTAGALANEAGICDVRAAIPTVAAASAGASLKPSPIIAVGVRLAREATSSALSAGSCS